MEKLYAGQTVRIIDTHKVGTIEKLGKKKSIIWYQDSESGESDITEVKNEMLTKVDLYHIDADTYKKLVRLEMEYDQLNIIDNVVYNFDIDGQYKMSLDDLYQAGKHLQDSLIPLQQLKCWVELLDAVKFDIEFGNEDGQFIYSNYDERNLMEYIDYLIDDISSLEEKYDESYVETIESIGYQITELIDQFNQNKDLPLEQKDIPEGMCQHMINLVNWNNYTDFTKEQQEFYKVCVERAMQQNDSDALLAYCDNLYLQTSVFETNDEKCVEIYQDFYDMEGNPFIANRLANLYYQGRTKDKKPDYDKAFKYFSIAHCYGIYEAGYKLADMFKLGQGVVANSEIAFGMYLQLYNDTRKLLVSNRHDLSEFDQITYRLGLCRQEGIVGDVDYVEAYSCYLQAKYVNDLKKQRGLKYDEKLAEEIDDKLQYCRSILGKKLDKLVFTIGLVFENLLTDNHCIKLKYKEKDDYSYSIKLTNIPLAGEEKAPDFLISIPECDYCSLEKDITINTSSESYIESKEEGVIIYDSISLSYDGYVVEFYLGGQLTGRIDSEYFIFKPKKKKN